MPTADEFLILIRGPWGTVHIRPSRTKQHHPGQQRNKI